MAAIAVAGAGGFIGSHIVDHLIAQGHSVIAVDRVEATWAIEAGATMRVTDLLDRAAAEAAFEGCDRVINATGLFDLAATEDKLATVNTRLAKEVALAARQVGAKRLVHVSSVAVYGKPCRKPMPEHAPQQPSSAYECTKQRGERAVLDEQREGFEVSVARPTLVYGPRSTYGQAMMIAAAAQAAALGARRVPLIEGGPLGHHVHVEDVARAVELLCFHPDAPGRCFNIADDQPLPFGDSLLSIAKVLGLKGLSLQRLGTVLPRPLWRVIGALSRRLPSGVLDKLNRQLERGHRALRKRGIEARLLPHFDRGWLQYLSGDYVFDTTRLRELGFSPKHGDFRRSIGSVIDWYRQHGWIAR